jgi:hypothetical protein
VCARPQVLMESGADEFVSCGKILCCRYTTKAATRDCARSLFEMFSVYAAVGFRAPTSNATGHLDRVKSVYASS